MSKERRFLAWNNFIAGLAVILPITGTVFVVHFLLGLWNKYLLDPVLDIIAPLLQQFMPSFDLDMTVVATGVKIMIFVLIMLAFIVIGILAKNILIRRFLSLGEGVVLRVPFVNKIYMFIQQISSTFFGEKKQVLSKVVLVEYPRKECYVLGLMTTECRGEVAEKLTGGSFVNVFVPTTPNPTSGFLIMVPRSDVIEMEISVEDAMKIIVSSGVVTPENGAPKTASISQ